MILFTLVVEDVYPYSVLWGGFMIIAVSVLFGNSTFYKEFDAKDGITIGEKSECGLRVPYLNAIIKASISGTTVLLVVSDSEKNRTYTTSIGEMVRLDKNRRIALIFNKADVYSKPFQLPFNGIVSVGSSEELNDGAVNDIVINLPYISRNHFSISCEYGECFLEDCNSTNGTFVNGSKVSSVKLNDGDVISGFNFRIVVKNHQLYFHNVGDSIFLKNQHSENEIDKEAPINPVLEESFAFCRAPRLLPRIDKEVISIERPPQANGKPQINWLSVLLTPMVSVALMVTLVFALGMSPVMLIMSGAMSVVSAVVAIISYNKQKKLHSKKDDQIYTKYHEYLDRVSERLSSEHINELNSLIASNPAPENCVTIASNKSAVLWSRNPTDEDFLFARVGLGNIKASVSATFQQAQVVIEENVLENEAKAIADNSKIIPNAPVLCDLLSNKQVGVIGSRNDEISLVRNMVIELATTHSYDELKIVAFISETEVKYWGWMRWLPHCMDNQRSSKYIFTSLEDADEQLAEIDETLSRRKNENGDWGSIDPLSNIPHYLFIVATTSWIEKHPIRKHLVTRNEIGCSSVFVGNKLNTLPRECDLILSVNGLKGEMYHKSSASNKTLFDVDPFTLEAADAFSRCLSPVYTLTEGAQGSLPLGVSFLDGYGVSTPDQLRIYDRWKNTQPYKSLAVPVAVSAGGSLFEFDIHEKKHGVNGIVAGMPGSGKTEMVQSWLLSLAVNYSPQDVSFVLIDFKGTGMIAPFRNLPHLAGSISNLDKNINRNLVAIQSEVHRREAIIDKYSNQSIKNINDLNRSYAQGFVDEKLPILLVVIDEYAEFKKNYPEFGSEIDSLTSKGRALGIFVILMTQKPAGVVSSKSEDNIKFRWCLRVANYGASREMLGRPDAAKISNPGRAFIKVGEDDVYEEVQSFWSGAPFNPSHSREVEAFIPISRVKLNGKRVACESKEEQKQPIGTETEIDAVVRYIADYCDKNHIPNAEKVWTDQLPERIAISELRVEQFDGAKWPTTEKTMPVIGLVDEPASQRQIPLALDFAELGHTVVYGAPVSGKTTLLQTLVMSLALTRKPDEVSIYIMDFGGWNMTVLAGIPHVGGIASDNNPDRLQKLTIMLNDMLNERIMQFSQVGVGNITAYREAINEENHSKIPDVFLVVDNFGAMIKMYPDLDSFFITLTNKGANYGIYLIASASNTNAVPMKINQNIKSAIALQMIDRSDYTSTVGKVEGSVPKIMGRGYVKGTPPLEFQTALPAYGETDKQISDRIRTIASQMVSAWSGELPDMIPEMPDEIAYGSVKSDGVVLGLSSDKIRPVVYDWQKQHCLLISGTARGGKSSMLSVVTRQLKASIGGRVIVFDPKKKLEQKMEPLTDEYLTEASEFDILFETLRPELQKRYEAYQQDNSNSFEPIILAIDDYSEFYSSISEDTASRLLPIVKIGSGLGIYLIAAGDAYDLSNHYNKGVPVTQALARCQQVVALGGCIGDHGCCSVLQSKTSMAQKTKEFAPYCGIVTNNNDIIPFKAMKDVET